MLNEEMHRYTELSGNSAEHKSIQVIGAYLDGYDKGASDVRENVRAVWIEQELQGLMGRRHTETRCGNCGYEVYRKTPFCPNCGADMRGE